MAILPIIKIKSDSPKGFRHINKVDFDKKNHKIYKAPRKAVSQDKIPDEIPDKTTKEKVPQELTKEVTEKIKSEENKVAPLLSLKVLKTLSEVALINYLKTHNIQPSPTDVTQDQLITKIALSDLIEG